MKLPPDHFQAQAELKQPARFGEKLMQQMGWEKGQGLGKEGQGRKEHIRVKKKDDNEGVGAGGGWNWGVKWWEQVFDEQATSLMQKASQTGSAAAAVKRTAKQQSTPAQNTNPQEPLPSPRQPSPRASQAAKHDASATLSVEQAPDRKRRKHAKEKHSGQADSKPKRQKTAVSSGRGQAALPTAPAAAQSPSADVQAPLNCAAVPGSNPIFGSQWAALEPSKNAANSKDSGILKKFKCTPRDNWWGAKHFASAGQLDGLQRKQDKADERQEFSEQDQTALYNQLQDGKSSGKGGLGKKSAGEPGVLRKSKFQGSRTVFDEDAAKPSRASNEPNLQTAHGQAAPRIKYKKLATSVLQQAPKRRMKCSKLEKLVHALIAQTHGKAVAHRCRQQAIVKMQVSKSRQFDIMNNIVSLTAV